MIYLRFHSEGKDRWGVSGDGKSIEEITPDYFHPFTRTGARFPVGSVQLIAPCIPSKIIALGLNYRGHAAEFLMEAPKEPLVFLKAVSSLLGPGGTITIPRDSMRVDYEGELAVVIGRRAKCVEEDEALDHILGYSCLNDVTARDIQGQESQWARSKSYDTFCPAGPWIVDSVETEHLSLETLRNGEVAQRGNTADMIFPVKRIVSFVSRIMTLEPGDIIATGTPPGVGQIKPGDRVEVRIENIGTLANPVAAENP